jgi:hypothetical protein
MTEQATPMLDYSGTATRYGVLCDQRDDGVTITLPQTMKNYLSGRGHPAIVLVAIIVWFARRALKLTDPPRMILELNRSEFRIDQRIGGRQKMTSQTWPRSEVGELRPNRYGPGLLVRIPGKDNFDILADCKPELVKWIGETLTAAMKKTQPSAEV